MSRTYDVCVIGAGICGCMIARELSRYDLDVIVLERTGDVGRGSSKANSGLIQTGFHARGGSLKGLSTVEGNALYSRLAEELDIPFKRIGGLYCAFGQNGMERIAQKHDRAYANGAGDLPVISGDEARSLEPRLSKNVIAALWAESTGIISPFSLVIALAENAAANGVGFEFDSQVENIAHVHGRYRIHLRKGSSIDARYVVNAAGDMAAILDAQVHSADLHVSPRRGEFIVFDKQDVLNDRAPITHVLFQAQEHDEGGTLLCPTIDGNILVGPTSANVRKFHEVATTQAGIDHVRRVAEKIVPDIQLGRVITSFAGTRANIDNLSKEQKDFVVRASAPGFVSLLGIKNPGMTAAPALASRCIHILEDEGLPLKEKKGFDPIRRARSPFLTCSPEEQSALLAIDPSFGHVICRCERITEGDVRRELMGVLPPHDLEGIKHRLRTSMGRCQGGFCSPRVQALLDEWHDAASGADDRQRPSVDALPLCCVSHPLETSYDVAVVGGGAAGLAAATSASWAGASVLLLERESYLGGVLPQCIHDGFGLYVYRENLTGPEYFTRWMSELRSSGAHWACETSVTRVQPASEGGFTLTAVGRPLDGPCTIHARAVVMAGGCREITRGQLGIPGTRPEGIYTAGTAQYMVNVEHKMPGDKVVILGGGDIGLIMARRMTLCGADVRLLVAKEATGLVRNYRRCIEPYRIPTRFGWGVASIHGYGRLKGVKVAPFNPDGTMDLSRSEYIRCNTLLISCGLVPERELFEQVEFCEGFFVTGNAESVHDLVDRVTVEALQCGCRAAAFAGRTRPLPAHLQTMSLLHVPELPVGERLRGDT